MKSENTIITLPVNTQSERSRKVVEARQLAVDELPLGSGDWSVAGVPGLIVRCGKRVKSYRLVRRIAGRLVVRTLGPMSVAEARREAMRQWRDMRPGSSAIPTLAGALESYLQEKPLSPLSAESYRKVIERYLPDLLSRRLDMIAADRAGMRTRIASIGKQRGAATAALVLRVYRAVHNWQRKVHPDLAESPTTACAVPRVKPRDWAMSDDELRKWWGAVKDLSAVRRAWWQTALMTGARAASVTNLRWDDVDFGARVIRFRVTKGDRPYAVPLAARLAEALEAYRDRDWLPNSEGWVFPSPVHSDRPLCQRLHNEGILSPHHLRHTMRTRLAAAGATPDLARVALGHSMGRDVSERYITADKLVEAVRPYVEAVVEAYARIMGL